MESETLIGLINHLSQLEETKEEIERDLDGVTHEIKETKKEIANEIKRQTQKIPAVKPKATKKPKAKETEEENKTV
jgi:seryl-tRNA synthetase